MDLAAQKKRRNVIILISVVIAIVVLVTAVIVVFLLLRQRRGNGGSSRCGGDSDCLPGFRCNPATKVCSTCFDDAECGGNGKICFHGVCFCPKPVINKSATMVQVLRAWPPQISVYIETDQDAQELQYNVAFTNSAKTYTTPVFFQLSPVPGTSPTFVFDLPDACDSLYPGYGCAADCGNGHTIIGVVSIQAKNPCGSFSDIVKYPVNGQNCNICTQTTC